MSNNYCLPSPCLVKVGGKCVTYTGPNIAQYTISTGDTLDEIVMKIVTHAGTGGGGGGSIITNNTSTINFVGDGFISPLQANVRLSGAPNQGLSILSDGLFYSSANLYTDADARAALSANSPLIYDSSTGEFSISQASSSTNGYLSATDWQTFNGKLSSSRTINTAGPLSGGGTLSTDLTLSIDEADSSTDGYISKEDWVTFNSKQAAISWQAVTAASNKITLAGSPTIAVNTAFSIDVNEGNLNIANMTGTLPVSRGGLGSLGDSLTGNKLVATNSAGTAYELVDPLSTDVTSVFARTGDVVAESGDYDTDLVDEGSTNLYFTTARARAALSAGTGINYNSSTGVIACTLDGSETKINAGANVTISGTGTSGDPYVINAATEGGGGENVLTFTTPLQRNTDTISILQAGPSQSGYLSATDWNAFNTGRYLQTTVTDLRNALTPSLTTPYFVIDAGQQGIFQYIPGDSTTPEDGNPYAGTVIVTAGGHRFKRVYEGTLYITWFGAVADDVTKAATNVTAFTKALAAAKTEQLVLADGGGTWYLNNTVSLFSTYLKRPNLKIEGNVSLTVATTAFILENFFPIRFEITGMLIGGNSGGSSTEGSWTSYIGTGVYLKNLYNSTIKVGEIRDFRVGIDCAGDVNTGIGTQELGSQYNSVYFSRIHHNYIQLRLCTKGAAGSHGNWCNENSFYGGQLGSGIPGVTYGGGGWIGLQIGSEPGSSQDTPNNISRNSFYDIDFEGLEKGIVAWNSGYNTFLNYSAEEEGVREHFSLAENGDPRGIAINYRFIGGSSVLDSRFVSGGRGVGTKFTDVSLFGKVPAGGSQYIGDSTVVVPNSPAMSGTGAPVPKTFLFSSDTYMGYTALNALADTTHNYWSKLSQYPTVQNGLIKFGGTTRYGAYKKSYLLINAGTPAGTINAPANLGYVVFNGTENKVVSIHPGDFATSGGFEGFVVEYNTSAYTLTFLNGETSAVTIASSNFPSVGKYKCVYRSGSWVIWRIDGGSASLSLGAVGSSPNSSGATYAGGVLSLQPASSSQPGVLSASGNQEIGGRKIFKATVTAGELNGLVVDPNITATANNDVLTALEIKGTYNASGFTGVKAIGLKLPSFRLSSTGNQDIDVSTNAEGLLFTAPSTPTKTYTNYLFASGFNNKDTYLMVAKTSTTTMGMANNGNDLVLATEKTTNGFIFRKEVGFLNINFTPGAFTGTNLMQIFANGNVKIKTGGTWTDSGYKLDVDGSGKFNDILTLGSLSADPTGVTGAIYYNTASNKFRGYENGNWVDLVGTGGGGGGGITTANNFGGSANARGLTISGSTITMNPASSTQPGGVSAGNQSFGGNKTFAGSILLRPGITGTGGIPLIFNSTSVLATVTSVAGALEYDKTDLWLTDNTLTRDKLLSASNVAIVTNKEWRGAPIELQYLEGYDFEYGVPTTSAGAGAGTSPTITLADFSTNSAGRITVQTGTTPSTSSRIVAIVFDEHISNGDFVVVFSAANGSAGMSEGVYAANDTNVGFSIFSAGVALAPSSTYTWTYQVKWLKNPIT